ncbi:CobW family GTP-binding protein [Paenibacillus pinistramenti]|uniref:CobW family GTP-binding protein n=1 Tax=Paenibacillus pinistramenti TaxID=1768003 RepID=UPI001396926F|nr:GTP-binding protein [Paenibacillus pinistramenti]
MDTAIPAVWLSGFLGSGKTTLLVKLLKEAANKGLRPGILMNELGKQDVDGMILQEETGFPIEKLLDGCVCCSKKEELTQSLETILHTNPDLLFIELTGVANPAEISELLSKPPFKDRINLRHKITLLDAEHALEYSSRFSADKALVQTLQQQLAAADLILVNKTDLVSEAKLSKVMNLVRKHNLAAAIRTTRYAEVDAGELLRDCGQTGASPLSAADTGIQADPVEKDSEHAVSTARRPFHVLPNRPEQHGPAFSAGQKQTGSASYTGVKTFTLPCPAGGSVSRLELQQFLETLQGQILRAKGYVNLADAGVCLMQYAGGRFTWESSKYPGAGYVVIIGFMLDPDIAASAWAELFRKKQSQITP